MTAAPASAKARSEKIATATVASIIACPRWIVHLATRLFGARIGRSGALSARGFRGQAVAARKEAQAKCYPTPETAS
jgi:hypothetical protein